jgi:hypothetical protein
MSHGLRNIIPSVKSEISWAITFKNELDSYGSG